jgi:hypothetical protein
MRKILSEKNIVVLLFVVAFVVFYFAQEDVKRAEQMHLNAEAISPSLISTARQTAGNTVVPEKKTVTSIDVE